MCKNLNLLKKGVYHKPKKKDIKEVEYLKIFVIYLSRHTIILNLVYKYRSTFSLIINTLNMGINTQALDSVVNTIESNKKIEHINKCKKLEPPKKVFDHRLKKDIKDVEYLILLFIS